MTHAQYGRWLATMWSATPGSMGMLGILMGVQQGRLGPVIVGLGLVGVAIVTYNLLIKVAKRWEGKEPQ